MKTIVGIVIAICLLYLCVIQTMQLVAVVGAVDYAQQELDERE